MVNNNIEFLILQKIKPIMNKPKLHLAAFFITLFSSVLGYGQSYNVSLINTNNYAAPGDSLEFELTISSAFSAGNFFQFGLAP